MAQKGVTERDLNKLQAATAQFVEQTAGLHTLPVLSESAFVEQTLKFANDGDPFAMMRVLFGTNFPEASEILAGLSKDDLVDYMVDTARSMPEKEAREFLADVCPGLEEDAVRAIVRKGRRSRPHESLWTGANSPPDLHRLVRIFLKEIAGGRLPLNVGSFAQIAERMILRPHIEYRDGTLHVETRYIAASLEAAIAYACMLFADGRKPYGSNLCQCQLVSCERFFMEREPGGGKGRKIRNYHSEECSVAAKAAQTVGRMERYRQRLKSAKRPARPK